jgi:DNA invertase Pin-like site-specific DNA recombinase
MSKKNQSRAVLKPELQAASEATTATPLAQATGTGTRVVTYSRVSTGRQAETDLSLPDQKRQLRNWRDAQNFVIVHEYVEGASGTTAQGRPVFQSMIEEACTNGKVDVIAVHSFSRFFRDAIEQELTIRRLAKHGVRVISITQPLGDGDNPTGDLARRLISLFDEYQSKENAKHVLRAMNENARQGYWNGSKAPYGYRAVPVEKKGARIKKVLEIDPVEAEVVRKIYALVLKGDGSSGPLGVKAVCSWLNSKGFRTRAGAHWGIGRSTTC